MADAKIKICSDPYSDTVKFFVGNKEWVQINQLTNPNSKLLSKEFTSSFFPFKAKDIVNQIVSEYQSGSNRIELTFEGSDDEFQELGAVCDDEEYSGFLTLERGNRYLANARDVLPKIIDEFESIQPLVDSEVLGKQDIRRDLDKFRDVSRDLIPLCILGNYSSGKSTFINALIGQELLPNGDMPVTAKVFEIKRSTQSDRGSIRFELGHEPVTLKFNDTGLDKETRAAGGALIDEIRTSLEPIDGMIPQMNRCLEFINGAGHDCGEAIGDLIEIEVPFFISDPWALENEFVIFDTPGSNSASNEEHSRVLRKAMQGLSNGMPIYVAEYSSLDSTDNEKLYDEIKGIEAMDERFAMIVVNKADTAELPRNGFEAKDIERIMDWAIPRNLYAQGIFFVSSILGLGSKTNGTFFSENYAEKYEDQVRKYEDPSNRFYKRLYLYNILPGQIRERAVAASESCDKLVRANSGLFCIEQEFVHFAKRYSAYNKCRQSEILLRHIISATSEEIALAKERREKAKAHREEALDRDKSQLIRNLEQTAEQAKTEAVEQFRPNVQEKNYTGKLKITTAQLKDREAKLIAEHKLSLGHEEKDKGAHEAFKDIRRNLGDNVADFFSNPNFNSAQDVIKDLVDDAGCAVHKRSVAGKTAEKAEQDASDELFREVCDEFEKAVDSLAELIEEASEQYWGEKAEISRKALFHIATNASVLSDEKRAEIEQIIIQYPQLKLEANANEIFSKSQFEIDFKIWNKVIFHSNRLNLNKFSDKYNTETKSARNMIMRQVQIDHKRSFMLWVNRLLEKVIDNITDYNPILHNHVELIREDTERINDLTARLDTLKLCTEHVSQMISWKE